MKSSCTWALEGAMGRVAARVLVLMGVLAGVPEAALGQSIAGDFQPPDARWIHPNGTIGLYYPGGTTITVDRNGNGIVGPADPADPVYTLPVEARQGQNYFLSPTREFLYVSGGQALAGCTGLTVRIYRLPFPAAAPVLVHADCLRCGPPLNGGSPQFYEGGLTQSPPYATGVSRRRLAFIVTPTVFCGSAQDNPEIRIYDLDLPGASGRAVVGLLAGWERFTVSQSGTYALVKHDLTNNPTNSDYTLINLCSTNFGDSEVVVDDGAGNIFGRLSDVSGGQVTVEVVDDGVTVVSHRGPDCLVGSGPPIGACCVNGVCTQTIQSACTGVWSQGVSCSSEPCPPPAAPRLRVSMVGPATVTEGDEVAYTLTYENTGNAAASNVVIEDTIPSGTLLVSASNGGFRDFSNRVVWNLGALPAASGPRTVTWTASVQCGSVSVNNSTYTIRATGVSAVAGTPGVVTAVSARFFAPVTITVGSVPSEVPLRPGDTVVHTIRLTNTAAQAQLGVYLTTIDAGAFATFERVTLGGSLAMRDTGPTLAAIYGDLGPSETVEIELVARMADCFDFTASSYRLNRGGNQILVLSRCNRMLGNTLPPTPVAIERPVGASMLVANIGPDRAGPPVVTTGTDGAGVMNQPVRAGAPLELELTFTNNHGAGVTPITTAVSIPEGITVGEPALLDPVPAGAGWDADSRTLSYSGGLPAGESVSIRLNVSVASGQCENLINVTGSTGSCSDVRASLRLLTAETAPAEPYLAGVGTNVGMWVNDLGPASSPRVLLCAPSLSLRSIARSPGGELYLVGDGCIRFNPLTLDFVDVGTGIANQLLAAGIGHWFFSDAAWDVSNGTLMVMGMDPYVSMGYLARFDPASGVATLLARDGGLLYRDGFAVDSGGRPYVQYSSQGVWTVDLTMPLPRPAGAGVIIPIVPAFGFGSALGNRSYSSVNGVSGWIDGTVRLTVRSVFQQDLPGQTVMWNVDSLMGIDAGVAATIQDVVAVFGSANPPPAPGLPPGVAGVLAEGTALAVPIASGPGGGVWCVSAPSTGANTRGLVELPAGTIVQAPAAVAFYLHDMVYVGNEGPPCPADFNRDGGIDGADVDAFFAAWEAGDASADVNQDGGVDGPDVDAFFAAWENGGCA